MGSEFPDDKMEGFTVKQRALDRPRKPIELFTVKKQAKRQASVLTVEKFRAANRSSSVFGSLPT